MAGMKTWMKALRVPFLTASAVPVILGTAAAWYATGQFNLLLFILGFLVIAFLHLGTNLLNDFYDHLSGNDAANKTPTPFSGGSRVIQDGLLNPQQVKDGAIIFLGLAALTGGYLVFAFQSVVLAAIGLIGLVSAIIYTAPPLKLGYRGLGEVLVAINFGPLPVLGAYFLQTGTLSWTAFWASLPVAILVFLILLINEVPDLDADRKAGKRTLVVLLSPARAVHLYAAMLFLSFALIILGILLGVLPLWTLLALFTIPVAMKASHVAITSHHDIMRLLPANGMTILLHLLTGLLVAAGFIMGKVVA